MRTRVWFAGWERFSPWKDCLTWLNHIKVTPSAPQDDRAAEHEARRRRQSAQGDHREGHLCHPAAASEALQTEPHLPGAEPTHATALTSISEAAIAPFLVFHTDRSKCVSLLTGCVCALLSRSSSTWLNTWCLPTASPSFWSSSTRTSCLTSPPKTGTFTSLWVNQVPGQSSFISRLSIFFHRQHIRTWLSLLCGAWAPRVDCREFGEFTALLMCCPDCLMWKWSHVWGDIVPVTGSRRQQSVLLEESLFLY